MTKKDKVLMYHQWILGVLLFQSHYSMFPRSRTIHIHIDFLTAIGYEIISNLTRIGFEISDAIGRNYLSKSSIKSSKRIWNVFTFNRPFD